MERSTLPSPADWSEFINASNSKVERDLAQLTLSDPEQRELYEAARLVQTAFCKYKVQAPRGRLSVSLMCCFLCVGFFFLQCFGSGCSSLITCLLKFFGHTLIRVFCLSFCLRASAHNINRRLSKYVPVVSAWEFALSRAWPCLEERLHSPLYPALIRHKSSLSAPPLTSRLSTVCSSLS